MQYDSKKFVHKLMQFYFYVFFVENLLLKTRQNTSKIIYKKIEYSMILRDFVGSLRSLLSRREKRESNLRMKYERRYIINDRHIKDKEHDLNLAKESIVDTVGVVSPAWLAPSDWHQLYSRIDRRRK